MDSTDAEGRRKSERTRLQPVPERTVSVQRPETAITSFIAQTRGRERWTVFEDTVARMLSA